MNELPHSTQFDLAPDVDEYTNHETDNKGFPLNPNCCAVCKRTSERMNAEQLSRLFGGLCKPGHDETVEYEDRKQDYPDGGMKR